MDKINSSGKFSLQVRIFASLIIDNFTIMSRLALLRGGKLLKLKTARIHLIRVFTCIEEPPQLLKGKLCFSFCHCEVVSEGR